MDSAVNRRVFLQQLAVAAGGTVLPAAAAESPNLQNLIRPCGKLFGFQANYGNLHNPEFASYLLRDSGIFTPGNELKWTGLHKSPDHFDFGAADWMVDWGLSHHLKIHGHNLCWQDYGAPDWLLSEVNPGNARQVLENHISTVAGRYAGKIHSWDVVNEVLMPQDRRSDLMGRHPWVDALGPEYIAIAFEAAAAADPKAILVWNEGALEHDNDLDVESRAALLKLLTMFKKRGVPIHALGLESHLHGELPLSTANLARFISEVRSLGIEIYITELDVDDTRLPADQKIRDGIVADYYKRYLDFMFRVADPGVIILWTLSDGANFLDWSAKTKPALYRRPDGLPHRPGILDSEFKEKPAYTAVQQAFSQLACAS
jgi:endo-1,4-beta-xylanase